MFCEKCGANIGDGSMPCPNCTVATAAPAPVADVVESPVDYGTSAPDNGSFVSRLLQDKKKLGIIGGALVVVIAVIVILIIALSGGAKSKLETYLDFYWNAKGDVEDYLDIRYPEERLDEILEYNDMTLDEYIENYEERQKEEQEELEFDGIKYTFDFISDRKMKSSEIDEYEDDAEEYGYEITEGMVYRVKVIKYVDGDKENTLNYEYEMVKMDGDWYYAGRKSLD